jgi:hypothetical protein
MQANFGIPGSAPLGLPRNDEKPLPYTLKIVSPNTSSTRKITTNT